MHATGTRALGTATVSRASRRIVVGPKVRLRRPAARAFGSSPRQLDSSSSSSTPARPSNGEAPSEKPPDNEADAEAGAARNEGVREVDEIEKLSASSWRRGRLNRAAGSKGRQTKRRATDDLPRFDLPRAFLETSVRRFDNQHKPRSAFGALHCPEAVDTWERLLEQATQRGPMLVPDSDKQGDSSPYWRLPSFSAMEDDTRYPSEYAANGLAHSSAGPGYTDVFMLVFDHWAWQDIISLESTPERILQRSAILSLSAALAIRGWTVDIALGLHRLRLKHFNEVNKMSVLKVDGMVNDEMQQLARSLKDKVENLELELGVTPILNDICAAARPLLAEQPQMTMREQLRMISPSTALFPEISTEDAFFEALCQDVGSDLFAKPGSLSASSDFKRPINIVNISNYAGKRLSTLLVRWLAYRTGADVVRVDALELSKLVGGYLGQDWAYSKGPISMLGFKVAELNDSLESPIKWPKGSEEDADEDTTVVQINGHDVDADFKDDPLFRELSKIKDNPKDYVLPSTDKWENLKIDKALEGIVTGAAPWMTGPADAAYSVKRRLIVHVDDIAELNMSIEGSLLVGRLRKIVDDLWLEGYRIALVGTSSVEKMSDRHVASLRELSLEDSVSIVEADNGRKTPWSRSMSQLDFLQTNLSNARNMWVTLAGSGDEVPEQSRILGDFIQQAQAILRYHNATAYFPPGTPKSVMGREQWHMIQSKLKALLDVDGADKFIEPLTRSVIAPAELFRWVKTAMSTYVGWEQPGLWLQIVFSNRKHKLDPTNIVFSAKHKSPENNEASGGAGVGRSNSRGPAGQSATQRLVEKLDISNEHEKKLLNGIVDKDEIKTTFADVHAPAETIAALKLLTSLSLKRPEAFSYGVLARDRIPGCLLYGPPGTGKTLLAKAVAKECGASMLEVSAASINDMWVGQGEKNVQAIFTLAKKMAPLVVFIDEADALLAARSQGGGRRSHREVINQFLREWDGMSDTNAFVMVATNRPFDLDEAVLRRLPRKILVDLPQQQDRKAILDILLRDERLSPDVDVAALARDTTLYSGSDLKNLCVAVAMAAVREEVEEAERHAGPGSYVYPEKRLLTARHFELAKKEIGASISDDMKTMREIRKFDETYGKPGRKRGRVLGFGVAGEIQTEASVRREESAAAGR